MELFYHFRRRADPASVSAMCIRTGAAQQIEPEYAPALLSAFAYARLAPKPNQEKAASQAAEEGEFTKEFSL
ncbi:hypothetical protein NVV94_10625 [Pseudomonas sp. LS1212]|uniref:hypothetical protein n=1 Tax=Pseudomonas sp. LS1212 TaxID=2972478 RepID=UPI00215BBCC0|nr:hypothetical protein [Pseudomonas sp. LS1212]UVJ45949.1 hypothetical protein NVV94_10625 [Pseudomonas sp. LS1212]